MGRDLTKLTLVELKERLGKRGLAKTGLKKDLIKRLEHALKDESDKSESESEEESQESVDAPDESSDSEDDNTKKRKQKEIKRPVVKPKANTKPLKKTNGRKKRSSDSDSDSDSNDESRESSDEADRKKPKKDGAKEELKQASKETPKEEVKQTSKEEVKQTSKEEKKPLKSSQEKPKDIPKEKEILKEDASKKATEVPHQKEEPMDEASPLPSDDESMKSDDESKKEEFTKPLKETPAKKIAIPNAVKEDDSTMEIETPASASKIDQFKELVDSTLFDDAISTVASQIHPDLRLTSPSLSILKHLAFHILHLLFAYKDTLTQEDDGDVELEAIIELIGGVCGKSDLATHAHEECSRAVEIFYEDNPKAGIVFPIDLFGKILENVYGKRAIKDAGIATSALIEYFLAEIIEIAGKGAKRAGRFSITPRFVREAVKMDAELHHVLKFTQISD
eukprot:TRINITY_DN3260_c0_g1_i2.p1 TRINITY_DN3260_c0_g1~~TRINITY_DN3260_c0_g1_i2.p1  ORF type:complete len:458 (-),score=152.90 TRINITY_DN3260_c0_g1_i2:1194-2546(-)